jgi:hypothetical protein
MRKSRRVSKAETLRYPLHGLGGLVWVGRTTSPRSPIIATPSECDRAGHPLPPWKAAASSPAKEKRLVRLPHCTARRGLGFGQWAARSSVIMGPMVGAHMRRKRGIFIFSLLNAGILFWCFEFWREGQPLERMIVVGLVCFPILNLIGWLSWRRGSGR